MGMRCAVAAASRAAIFRGGYIAAASGRLRTAPHVAVSAPAQSLLRPGACYSTNTEPPATTAAAAADADEKQQIIAEMKRDIGDIRVVLFMKGEPESPRCGFSNKAVEILQLYGVAYTSYNVLAHQAVRDGIKEISGWPTIPQLFVRGEFVGGCDLMMEMH